MRGIEMKTKTLISMFLIFFASQKVFAVTNYVSKTGGHISPFTNWANAATNIQAAVDAASDGNAIIVSNGTYILNSEIDVNKSLRIQSLSESELTIIDGNNSVRCFKLYDYNTVISGFTITNGNPGIHLTDVGGGASCLGTNPIITNCVIAGNTAGRGGGIYKGSVYNCIINGNFVNGEGGGIYQSVVYDCLISQNKSNGGGGGTFNGTISNCKIYNNIATRGGGSQNGTLENCIISGNEATDWDGGGTYISTVNNCTIIKNIAKKNGGGTYYCTVNNCAINENFAHRLGGGAYAGTLNNCTITENKSELDGGGTAYSAVNNSIIYYNSAPVNPNRLNGGYYDYNYCCTTPDATNGSNNIISEPMLVSSFRISTNSPCVAAGSTNYISGTDIDGEIWKDPPSIGCDEIYANAVSGSISVAINFNNIYTYLNTPLSFSANIEGKVYQNVWCFDDGTTETNKLQINHSWNSTGKFNIVLVAFNETYPSGISNSIFIEVLSTNIHYVNKNNSTPVAPYQSWKTAATNIINAVKIANNGGEILITNGVYVLNSEISVDKSLIIKSVNGAQKTIIDGNNSTRCFRLYNHNTKISGLTITNGNASSSDINIGGGVKCFDTTPEIDNCILTGNQSYYGAGIYKGTINNCLLTENFAYFGGAAYQSEINNCTIVTNVASQKGGGTYNCIIYNTIIWDNFANNGSNNYFGGEINFSCSLPLAPGDGNISNNPNFVSSIDKNWRLQPTSLCINAGTNLPYTYTTTDLAGNQRIYDGTVDMGCYEFVPEPCSFIIYNLLIVIYYRGRKSTLITK